MKNKSVKPNQAIISCFLAGCLEMYEFAIFGLLATVIHKKYFSFMSPDNSLVIAYALFAVGFVCRPVGSIIFGYIGDIYGRKKALVTSVSIMGIASLSMCLMPSYESIGVVSCYLIALARIMQGISLGGEFSGGIIYAIEHSNKSKHGLIGSSVVAGFSVGILLATIVSVIVQSETTPEYSWRFAFFLGFGLSIIGFFIRQKLTETPEFLTNKKSITKVPLLTGFREYTLESITTMLIAAAGGSNLYFVVVYVPVYLKGLTGLDLTYLPMITTIALISLSSFWGWKSDQIGRSKLVVVGVTLNAIYILIMLPLATINPSFLSISLIIAVHAILFSIINGTTNVFAVELFPVQCRYSCYAFCHSIGMGLIGGTTPMVAALITKHSNYPNFVLGLYISILTLLAGIFVGFTIRKKKKNKVFKSVNLNEIDGQINKINSKYLELPVIQAQQR